MCIALSHIMGITLSLAYCSIAHRVTLNVIAVAIAYQYLRCLYYVDTYDIASRDGNHMVKAWWIRR
ncbi:hypothetical protein HanIR_Chr06g0280481 [Helianthus annuus]|nr:hypothetical protein HanIR_Chr06g0280481 [Helianthus annuus]